MVNLFLDSSNARNAAKTYIMNVNVHSDTHWYSFNVKVQLIYLQI